MKPLYLKEFVIFFCLFSAASFTANAQSSTAYFDLDACNAIIASGDNMDYSEFTAQINNNSCVELGIVGGYLYRNNPTANKHSCTPGVNGEPAMCISSYPGCDFSPGLDEALRIDVLVTPDVGGTGSLNELTFYEQAPPAYNWINGASGPNNYPTLFSVRVLKNGTEVYLSIDIATSSSWNLNTFSFSGLPEFNVSEPTVFNIELLPYCPVGNGEPVSAWDIDEIYISASCCDAPSGGEITGGPFEFCVGDGIPDHVSGIVLTGQTGPNSQWVITDDQNNILSLPSTPESVNFDGGGPGICLIWHISYEDGLVGLVAGNNLLTDLQGCFGISNSISVIRNQPEGGLLSGGPFEFCVGDSIPDYATGIVLSGNVGTSSLWVVTDAMNTILNLPVSIDSVDFDGAGPGICLIWNISFFDTLSGLIVGNNLLNDVSGCHDLSNSISVIRNHPEGGELSGGPFEFCVGDSIPDHVFGIVLTGNIGDSTQYIITDEANNILNLPDTLEQVDFDGGGQGVCLIWHISYFYAISGLEVGGNLGELAGCFALSNPVSVIRTEPDGGELTGGPFEFCVGDSIPDHVSGIILSGTAGNTQWVITNDSNIILSLPDSIEAVNFDGGGPGICLIWNVSYVDTLSGLVPGNDLFTDVTGCFNVSNSISVVRNQPEGGELIGGPFEFCVGDNIPDYVSGIELVGNVGDSSVWVVTDDMNVILSIPQSIDSVNFDGGGPGICLIWNVSFFDTISGLVAGNNLLSDLSGCFDLSNSISVIRTQPDGGELTGGPFEFCVGDSIPDHVSGIVLTGTSGNTQWVITNDSNIILSLPDSIEAVDFDGGGPGICLIWNVGYVDTLSGLVPGNDLFTDVTGCFNVSNSISVVRNQPEGGELIGGPFEFCVGDSIPDTVSGIELVGNAGTTSQWVVTNDSNIILSFPDSLEQLDFDGGGPGICLIWNISYFDTIAGFEIGNDLLNDLSGCFGLSNPVTVIRNDPEGGTLAGGPFEFCVGDSIPDHVSGIVLTGNVGDSSQYVITDEFNVILNLPEAPEDVDFDQAPPGTCLIWHVSYYDTLAGLMPGNNLLTDLSGCFSLSNSIAVVRLDCSGLQGDDVLKMQVFPNPVRDKVTLRMSHPGKEDLRVQIIDASGRLCLIENYNTASDIIIDMSRFADGIYFLKAQGDGKYKTERLLLVR